jgi:capsule polysaccharide export protein KpsE/RkpR
MYSTSVQDEIIDRFHLMELYGTNLREDARHQLEDHTEIVEDLPSGIITISVTDRSPQRASEMARAYITGLNRCLGRVNTSAAHKERVFIEERLRDTRQRLDESARKFSDFSSKNAVINVTEQGKVLLESAAHLQGQLIAARSSLAGLEQIYTPGHARMRSLRARTMDLQQQLQAMTKVEGKRQVDVHKEDNFTYPSIQKLPLLAQKYFDLLRQKMVYESVLGALSQEYERAKLEEAKGLPSVRVIDLPVVPEKRAGPLRIVVVLCGILLSVLFGSAWILAKNYFPATWPARRSIAVNHNSHP